jgi:hypothetical protein
MREALSWSLPIGVLVRCFKWLAELEEYSKGELRVAGYMRTSYSVRVLAVLVRHVRKARLLNHVRLGS